jgi:hypothetical protein
VINNHSKSCCLFPSGRASAFIIVTYAFQSPVKTVRVEASVKLTVDSPSFRTQRPPDPEQQSAFERHAKLPHTQRFLGAAADLLANPIQGLRLRKLVGDSAANPR